MASVLCMQKIFGLERFPLFGLVSWLGQAIMFCCKIPNLIFISSSAGQQSLNKPKNRKNIRYFEKKIVNQLAARASWKLYAS